MELHFPHLTNGIHAPAPRKRKISLVAPMILSLGVAATLAYFILQVVWCKIVNYYE